MLKKKNNQNSDPKKTLAKNKVAVQKKPEQAESSQTTLPPAKKTRSPVMQKQAAGFPIVGIGASAGGLEALETFFSRMPAGCNIAFVIIQHLSPKHKSIMGSLLSKHTSMKICEVEDGLMLEPGRVYLNPPDKNVAIFNGALQLMDPVATKGFNLPIDFFFRSLAENQGEKAIGIILSGTATDGTLGIRAIKGEGGIAIVQDPVSAKYDGMPRSAIATGLVDYILPVEEIPDKLLKYLEHPYIEGSKTIRDLDGQFTNYLQKTFALIRTETGHDFSHYKQTTIRRRIERRMAVHQLKKIEEYVKYLQANPAEVRTLFKDLLIGVTGFFRDPEAFKVLEEQVIPALFKARPPDVPIRIWVVGCASGEEAYSIAMLFSEARVMLKQHFEIQIFASDIDAQAVDHGRRGGYPDSIAADVTQTRLKRFFIKEDSTYKVKKEIREMVVFAVQNIIKDPPFSKIDLLSCRNLLIYMDAELQKKVLPLCHFALNREGILFLGPSETIGAFTDLFGAVNRKWKIYQRRESLFERPALQAAKPLYDRPALLAGGEKKTPGATDIHEQAKKIILENYTPPAVLVNENFEVLHFLGKTGRYLEVPTGKARFNVIEMAREGLRPRLSAALHNAVREKKTTSINALRITCDNEIRTVSVTVRPLTETSLPQTFMLVVFDDRTPPVQPLREKGKRAAKAGAFPAVTKLEQELESTREDLQTTIEELETSNEELKSINEELQSVNEELQSTNEELETSKEELQSTNEELVTVNAELQDKVQELSRANNDISNLLSSTGIGTIFLDTNLCVQRFTPAATKVFNLIATDLDRSIGDITSRIDYDGLIEDAHEVLKTLVRKDVEVQDKSGNWFAIGISPYRTTDYVINGVVITFVDITEVKEAAKLRRLATVVADSNDAVTVQDFNGKILAWNKGAEKMYGWSEAEALAMHIAALIPENKIAEAREVAEQVQSGKLVESFRTERLTRDGRKLDVWMTVTKLVDDQGRAVEMATTERDFGEVKKL